MTTAARPALPLAATRPLRTDELRSLLLYVGATLAAMGLLLVPPLLRQDLDLLRILTPVVAPVGLFAVAGFHVVPGRRLVRIAGLDPVTAA